MSSHLEEAGRCQRAIRLDVIRRFHRPRARCGTAPRGVNGARLRVRLPGGRSAASSESCCWSGDRPRARRPAAGRARWPVGCRCQDQGTARIPPLRHVEATSTQPRSPGLRVIGTRQIVLVSSAFVSAGNDVPVPFRFRRDPTAPARLGQHPRTSNGRRPPNGPREGTNKGTACRPSRRSWHPLRRQKSLKRRPIDEFRPPPRSSRHDGRHMAGAHHHRHDGRGCVCRPRRPREPHGSYEMTQRVAVFDPSRAISRKPGHDFAGDGKPQLGGWSWRNDLVATEPSDTEVTPTDDWTAVASFLREHLTVPPFPRTTSRTRCATSRSWSNRPRPTAFRQPVAELMANRRPRRRRSMPSPAPERKESR